MITARHRVDRPEPESASTMKYTEDAKISGFHAPVALQSEFFFVWFVYVVVQNAFLQERSFVVSAA
jgi:hypothetical protein